MIEELKKVDDKFLNYLHKIVKAEIKRRKDNGRNKK